MAEQRKYQTYVEGNTVRKIEPLRREEPRTPEQREIGKKTLSREARRNQERSLRMSAPFVIVLAMASAALLGICLVYLQLQSSITTHIYNIEQYEAQISELQVENRSLASKINTCTDLDYIYQVATEELGMVYPGEDQVIVYDRTESEYVRQYENIPE